MVSGVLVEWSSEVVEWSRAKVEWSSGVVEWSSREVESSSGVVEWSSGVVECFSEVVAPISKPPIWYGLSHQSGPPTFALTFLNTDVLYSIVY